VKIIYLDILKSHQLPFVKEEIRLLEKLTENKTDNPHIIKFYEKFEDTTKNIIYLVMEIVEGGDLENWL
jgi:serine/threonine protein kinase